MTSLTSANNKIIAKNTALLYLRMIFLVIVKLYSSRVILIALGVEDYGIYTAVGGIVAMFSVLTGSLSTSISRFITYQLGKKDINELERIFSNSVNVLLLFGILILLLSETIGIWFLNTKMNIPSDSWLSANLVFQFSIFTFLVNFLSIPYNALIIAHEKMSAFAYISILEVILQLLLVFALFLSSDNRLIYYACFVFFVSIIIRSIYGIYCKRNFIECKITFGFDKKASMDLMSFAGWNFMGATSWVLNTQGVNLLTNIFFNVFVNAARGVVGQIEAALTMFVNNFITAIVPQITKAYSEADFDRFNFLVINGTKFSAYIVGFVSIPMIVEIDSILSLWLKEVPEYVSIFSKITIISIMTHVLGNVLHQAVCSVGKIKKYQILISLTTLMIFCFTWFFYALGYSPVVYYIVNAIIYFCVIFVRLYCLKENFPFETCRFLKSISLVIIIWILSYILVSFVASCMTPSILRIFIVCIINCTFLCISILYLEFNNSQRIIYFNKIKKLLCQKKKF